MALIEFAVAVGVVAVLGGLALWLRHPAQKPVAAVFIFLTAFAAASGVAYFAGLRATAAIWGEEALAGDLVAIALLLVAAGIGLAVAVPLVRRAPLKAPRL